MSVAVTEKVTVWLCEEVLSATEVSSAVISLTVGFWLSTLVIVCVILSVDTFPAASVTVTETVVVLEPKL